MFEKKIGSRYVLKDILGSFFFPPQRFVFRSFLVETCFEKIKQVHVEFSLKTVNTFHGHRKAETFDIAP